MESMRALRVNEAGHYIISDLLIWSIDLYKRNQAKVNRFLVSVLSYIKC
jgi:hypothetical protein